MSRIGKAFENEKAFIPFITAGDPSMDKTKEYIRAMIRGGADLIEIGIPFSDPIAEGIVIQEADIRALAAGTTVDEVFELVAELRGETDIPLVFMTYLNPVFHYGYEKFFAKAAAAGLDGIIIPDAPYEEKEEIDIPAAKYGIDLISMVAPTSKDRIRTIAAAAKGFLYVVSSMGVTGVRSELGGNITDMLDVIREVSKVPAAVGFGVNTPEQAADIARVADGVIVGSAIIKIIAKDEADTAGQIYAYVKSMKDAIR